MLGGGPEMVVDSISTKDGDGVATLVEFFVDKKWKTFLDM